MNHTKTWRLAQYDEISKLISQFKIIGIADLKDFPSNLLQKVKKNIDDATTQEPIVEIN